MTDIINHIENIETSKSELWITIKDASDLLGISERHTWNVVLENGLQKKKLLNKSRKKTYVLRADIEKFYKEARERQGLEALKPHPSSEISEKSKKRGELEISESGKSALSESQMAILERDFKIKGLPALLSEMQKKQETLLKDATTWRVTTIWVSVLGVVVAGFLYFYLTDTKKVLSEMNKAFSESQKALLNMAEREKEAIKTISEREIYIKELELAIPKEKTEQLKVEEKKGE
ncbi:MAG: hypothetical protein Q8O46_02010 [bacterium]|nr:hypothetical protein [bacterium]